MKIKLENNQVTIRLSAEDLEQLKDKGIIRTKVEFPYRPLYAYLETIDIPEISGDFTEEGFQFFFPQDQLENWSGSSKVGFKNQVGKIHLVIEKDLPKRSANPVE